MSTDTPGTSAPLPSVSNAAGDVEARFDLVFDCDKKAVACVLLQAAAGCDSSLLYHFGFDSAAWLVAPTPGMRRIRGTEQEWRKAAEMANDEWQRRMGEKHE